MADMKQEEQERLPTKEECWAEFWDLTYAYVAEQVRTGRMVLTEDKKLVLTLGPHQPE